MSGHGDDDVRAPETTASFAALRDESTTRSDRPSGAAGDEGSSSLSGEDLQGIAALPPRSALLIVGSGANAGARFLLDSGNVSVGRHPGSDIFLDDVTVSRRHAAFVQTEEGFSVRDAGSLNGTYVNRERVDVAPLAAGDEVQIGKFRLTFHPHVAEAGDEG